MKDAKFKFSVVLFFVLFCFSYANLCYSSEDAEYIADWVKRIDFGADMSTETKPRFYFETVQPLSQDIDKQDTIFTQLRYALEDENSAVNLGLGYRKLLNENSTLLGLNSFFDYENDAKHYRVGLGGEAFINQIELRGNAYIGLSPRRLVNDAGNTKEYEKAVDGFDAEFGIPLPYLNWIKVFGGGYWYNYELFSNKHGWRIRNEIRPFNFNTINLIIYDDNKGDVEFRVDARVSIPIGAPYTKEETACNIGFSEQAYLEKIDHSDRTLDRVEREHKIEVERYVESVTATIEVRRGD